MSPKGTENYMSLGQAGRRDRELSAIAQRNQAHYDKNEDISAA